MVKARSVDHRDTAASSPPVDEGVFDTVGVRAGGTGATRLGALEATIGPVPRVDLRAVDSGCKPAPGLPPLDSSLDAHGSIRYQIEGEIARGGMGSVLKGRDPDIGRDIALKVLRDDYRDNTSMVRRFVEEAQIGGQLQHPGIVPVYEMGVFDDRRPFFAMKLIKGETLADRLARRGGPGEDLPRLIAIFEAVAQAVAYAHARGVIHRDLKPANIMLGSFGEVQVMDWGLAKVLPRSGAGSGGGVLGGDSVIATTRTDSDNPVLSLAGSAMGTPSYMAPEQARGEVERIDERADVFALGSILCEILTGRPAFTGGTVGAILSQAILGDLAEAQTRLDRCSAAPDLVKLARDCLAAEPAARPREAGVVAARVAAHLAGVQERLRRAEIGAVEERARRRLTTVAAAALILLALVGTSGYVWLQQQQGLRRARTTHVVGDALADAVRLRGMAQATPDESADARWAEARAAVERAEELLAQGEAGAALRERVASLRAAIDHEALVASAAADRRRADRDLIARLEAARTGRAEHDNYRQSDADYSAAFRAAGLDLDAVSPAEAGQWIAARPNAVELISQLDTWAYLRRHVDPPNPHQDWRRLVAAARAADPDPWRNSLRALAGSFDPGAIDKLRQLANDQTALNAQPAPNLVLLARHLKQANADLRLIAKVLQLAVARDPTDYWSHYELATLGSDPTASDPRLMFPNPSEAVRHLTACVAIRPRGFVAHLDLGSALWAQGNRAEAEAEFRTAIRLRPNNAGAHRNLERILTEQGKPAEAETESRVAKRLRSS